MKKDLLMNIRLGDVFEIVDNDGETAYAPVQSISGCAWDGEDVMEANCVSLQATNKNGKVYIITLAKINKLPNGWKGSSWSRFWVKK